MMWDGDGWSVVMWVWMAAFWLAVVAGVVWLLRSMRTRPGEAWAILDRRLASGEIDLDEHRRLRAELTEVGPALSSGMTLGPLIVLLIIVGIVAVVLSSVASARWDMWDHMGWMHGRGSDRTGSVLIQGSMVETIAIEDFAFRPGNLEVPVGANVTWRNDDGPPHDATERNGDWQTQRLSEGESESLTFDRTGNYDYYCSIHPSMKARLVVR